VDTSQIERWENSANRHSGYMVLREERTLECPPVHNTPASCRSACTTVFPSRVLTFSPDVPYIFLPGEQYPGTSRASTHEFHEKSEKLNVHRGARKHCHREIPPIPTETAERGRKRGKLSENTYSSQVNFNNAASIIKPPPFPSTF